MHLREPEFTDEERAAFDERMARLGVKPVAQDAGATLFDRISDLQSEALTAQELNPGRVVRPDLGEIKSVGGVDYQVTEKGWIKIGLTPVEGADS